MEGKPYALVFTMLNGTVLRAEFVVPKGERGPKGEKGDQGPKGVDGTSVTILGSYDSEENLIAEHPTGNTGESYLIDSNLYVWSATSKQWQNVGHIQGPKGDPGVGIVNISIREV